MDSFLIPLPKLTSLCLSLQLRCLLKLRLPSRRSLQLANLVQSSPHPWPSSRTRTLTLLHQHLPALREASVPPLNLRARKRWLPHQLPSRPGHLEPRPLQERPLGRRTLQSLPLGRSVPQLRRQRPRKQRRAREGLFALVVRSLPSLHSPFIILFLYQWDH